MEYIIKYTGDILSLGYPTELLDAQFAIMELRDQPPSRLLEHRQGPPEKALRRRALRGHVPQGHHPAQPVLSQKFWARGSPPR